MISKEIFVRTIYQLKEARDLQNNINDNINKCEYIEKDFLFGESYIVAHENLVIMLLKEIMNDQWDDIGYFIYELDFGRDYKEGMITEEDGTIIDFSTAEKLYDYLIKNNK